MSNRNTWIDVSVPLHTGMVHWPGDPDVSFRRISEISQGSNANVTTCEMPVHTGTHMDAPCHFIDGADGIDQFPLEVGIGPARILQIDSKLRAIGREELEGKGIGRGDRVLLRTRNSEQPWHNEPFRTDY